MLVIDNGRASYTQAMFIERLAAGATIVVMGCDHLPAGMMLPMDGHHSLTHRHCAQVETSAPLHERLWQAMVAAKLRQKGRVLKAAGRDDAGLTALASRVRHGDPDNLEA
ncbi:hypothetical protein CBR61_09575 [Porphyrobacter sp. CACIAM 03H1]|nr:hypothetical protein CBR61_09575 [Porphyrobacter sp. CACIAM 03H1]